MTTFKEFAERSGIEFVVTYKGVHADKRTTHKPERPEKIAEPWQHFLWSVTLRLGELGVNFREFTTEYRARVGALRMRPLTGKAVTPPTPPDLEGILNSLQCDAQSGEHLLFEDFASDFGYDPDSREAERVWRACQTVRGQLQKFFGGAEWPSDGTEGASTLWGRFLELEEG